MVQPFLMKKKKKLRDKEEEERRWKDIQKRTEEYNMYRIRPYGS